MLLNYRTHRSYTVIYEEFKHQMLFTMGQFYILFICESWVVFIITLNLAPEKAFPEA